MVRRFISCCVLAGFFVAQWAALPHAHAGWSESSGDHNLPPHMHLEALGLGVRNCPLDIPQTGGPSGLTCPCTFCCAANHDADAIYLPAFSTLASTANGDQGRLLSIPTVVHCWDKVTCNPLQSHLNLQATFSASRPASACPVYLALGVLRI